MGAEPGDVRTSPVRFPSRSSAYRQLGGSSVHTLGRPVGTRDSDSASAAPIRRILRRPAVAGPLILSIPVVSCRAMAAAVLAGLQSAEGSPHRPAAQQTGRPPEYPRRGGI